MGNLVLTRKPEEAIVIGTGKDRVIIRVGWIRDCSRVGLLIDAPKEVAVHREEIYNAIHGEERTN